MNKKYLLKICVTVVVTAILLYKVGLDKFALSLSTINIPLFCLAFLFFPVVVLIGSLKWKIMVRHEAEGITFEDALVSFLCGMTLGLLTPGRVGEFGRIGFISQGRKAALAGIALIDKIVDLEITLALGVVGTYVLFGETMCLILSLIVLTGGVFIFSPELFSPIMRQTIYRLPFKDKIRSVISGMTGIPKKVLLQSLVLRLAASLVDMFQFFLLLNSFVPVRFLEVVSVYPIVLLSNILPLTIGGLGIRESVSLFTLSQFGVSAEAAVNSSFLLFCLNTLLPGLIGAGLLPRFKMRSLTRDTA